MSEEAKHAYITYEPRANFSAMWAPDVKTERVAWDQYLRKLVERAKAVYPVTIEQRIIGGVRTDVITPRGGLAAENRDRVLIDLHGGGFVIGAGAGGLAESVPIASSGRIQVISVDYREAPEYKFPAASEDVAAVYRELLKRYKPEHIGIYGCSAGGMLSAMAVAWFQKKKLPVPGAIGIFCAGAGVAGGDSLFTSAALDPYGAGHSGWTQEVSSDGYLSNVSVTNPLVYPAISPAVLVKFPPTLLISGTRDPALSSLIETQRQMTNVGVEADMHLWDGMWHGFFLDVNLPESKEAFNVIVKFFDTHLHARGS